MTEAGLTLKIPELQKLSPQSKRVLMHIGFWVFWLSRTFYDLVSLYGLGPGEILFMVVYTATQVPMMYFHLYVLVPRLFNRKRYVLYGLSAIALVFAYSFCNYELLTTIPSIVKDSSVSIYIADLNWRYDVFEGFFTLVITYALKYAGQNLSTQNRLLQLEKDNLILELEALKAQINPHFLFNTLNNIYSLSLRKSEKAPEMILKLSDMMRYVLYECSSETVPMEREIQFINNYIDLERIRHGDHVSIHFSMNSKPGESKIEPLLLIPIIENSFKHGIHAQMEKGFVDIQLNVEGSKLSLLAMNSITGTKPFADMFRGKKKNGIGLENVRKRLELLYPNNHRLTIDSGAHTWKVNLELNLT
ncbi:MAG: histidine kinase [Chitinophagales bacterium]|nr:histidine kinase [Chitinophagales bacterium]